jgi:mannose-6-phosphate isomerase-like protein (cupin superfamily)
MDTRNINEATAWFEVLQTTERSQTAMMTLAPGKSSGKKAEVHEDSDQVMLILKGELIGAVGDENLSLKKGDVITIPSGVKHRFTNRSRRRAVTFNVYSPPAYPAD